MIAPDWILQETAASDLHRALLAFAPPPGTSAVALTHAWMDGLLFGLLGPRYWKHTVTVAPGESLPDALLRLAMLYDRAPSHHDRGAVFLPAGTHVLHDELDLAPFLWFDLLGESRDSTTILYDADNAKSAIWARSYHGMIAHMTIARPGRHPNPPPSGLGSRYAIHNNTGSAVPRRPIFADLDLQTTAEGCSPGAGTTFDQREVHLFVGVNADHGLFSTNGEARRIAWEYGKPMPRHHAPGAIVYLNCTAGVNQAAPQPIDGLRHWNVGTGQPDVLAICGGRYHGTAYGLRFINFGAPYHGQSETVAYLCHNPQFSGEIPIVLPPDTTTHIIQGDYGQNPASVL